MNTELCTNQVWCFSAILAQNLFAPQINLHFLQYFISFCNFSKQKITPTSHSDSPGVQHHECLGTVQVCAILSIYTIHYAVTERSGRPCDVARRRIWWQAFSPVFQSGLSEQLQTRLPSDVVKKHIIRTSLFKALLAALQHLLSCQNSRA